MKPRGKTYPWLLAANWLGFQFNSAQLSRHNAHVTTMAKEASRVLPMICTKNNNYLCWCCPWNFSAIQIRINNKAKTAALDLIANDGHHADWHHVTPSIRHIFLQALRTTFLCYLTFFPQKLTAFFSLASRSTSLLTSNDTLIFNKAITHRYDKTGPLFQPLD